MAALCAPVVVAPRTLPHAASAVRSRLACTAVKARCWPPRLCKSARFPRCSSLSPRATSSDAAAGVPTLEELMARLQRGEAPAGGFDALAFTLPTSRGEKRITARIAPADHAEAATRDVPPDVMRAIEAHVLRVRPDLYLASATEDEISSIVNVISDAFKEIYPPGVPCAILYVYLLDGSYVWVYDTPPDGGVGLCLRDIVRCIVATYRVIYEAEACAVGAEAHAARAGPRLYNRGATEGPFGIWGHDLGDLVLEGFEWAQRQDGSGGALLPSMGS
jgi:hypothetical protein